MKKTSFREFVENNMEEEKTDIQNTLSKLPDSYQSLVKGYKWKFHSGNTLNGDNQHVGYIDDKEKTIAVAAPWNYSREFTILHEIGHKVWENFVANNQQLIQQWHQIVQNTKTKQNQEPEELFCMAFACHYAKHKVFTHYKKEWDHFIKNLPQ